MKFSLIAAVVLLALAHGSFAQDAADLDKLSAYFEEIKAKMTQDLSQILSNQDLASQAQTFLDDNKKTLEPLAAQVHDQLKSVATSMDDKLRPLAERMQGEFQPMIETFQKQVEDLFQRMTEQGKAIGQ
ncbi:type-4 ice-structuring protein-like [Odontesthes bonariensis]|uniref:type-4 ice-structuring protein-like n=1 Tax=Odontesthes bonariensis TaxID=219752 RepID=UPI003F581C78